jgi:hypothetical protein
MTLALPVMWRIYHAHSKFATISAKSIVLENVVSIGPIFVKLQPSQVQQLMSQNWLLGTFIKESFLCILACLWLILTVVIL